MSDWLLNLPVVWLALVVFAATYLAAAGVYLVVIGLAVDDRARAFKALSPGMLPPLGIIFGLLVGFIAAQVWSDFERAKIAVASEATALRAVVLLAEVFPDEKIVSALRTQLTWNSAKIRNSVRERPCTRRPTGSHFA